MNCTVNTHHCGDGHGVSHLIFLPILALCLAFAVKDVRAADAYYVNNAIVAYPGTAPYPPQIDATNFINNSSFTVNFTALNSTFLIQPYYESLDTLNYTNYGLLMVNAGFRFDTDVGTTGFHRRAANFANFGTISCGSVDDTTDPLFGLFAAEGFAQCYVDATNVLNPGEINVGENGLIHLSGNNVDLTGSLITVEGAGANAAANSVFDLNTNFWDPSLELGPNFAQSGFFPIAPFELTLTNSTAYFDNSVIFEGTNIIRGVFIEDNSGSNVNVNVFFDTAGFGLGAGSVTIQWAGSYSDPASGLAFSNYLYLTDDYVLGASTNVLPIVGVPANFTLTESTSPIQFPVLPAVAGFPVPSPFFPGTVTNFYVYANLSLIASASTNLIPNQSITNLPGRIEISADSQLNLAFSQISGQSYMSLRSTNQFNGSAGAFIETPYADINLGATNGPLILTNVMEATIPFWGGTVQAWNTRWTLTDTTLGVTNDYRILIVGSRLTPEISAQVQNLILRDYQSNSIVISDTFNVMSSFYADSKSLTLTTNPAGAGSTSFEGELNLQSPNIFFQNSTPNLQWLTNYGAIRMQNLGYFGYPTETNVVPPVPASGMLSEIGTNVVKKDKVTVGSTQYLFVSTLTNSVANEVAIVPASFDASMSNLIAAINGTVGAGTAYSTATKSNSLAKAGPLINHAFTVTARTNGTSGNTIASTFTAATTSVNLSWNGHTTLFGGAGTTTNRVPYLFSTALINNGIFSDQGSIFYAGNFESSGIFSNGIGSFSLLSLTTTLTNGAFYAGGDVSITASNLVTSNLFLQASRSLTLKATNLLTDTGPSPTNNNIWLVGAASVGSGFNLPIKPVSGDLLGTSITLTAPTNRTVTSVWAGMDRGLSVSGYVNNEAVGLLTFDVPNPAVVGHNGVLTFNAAGISNALYVDCLVLTNFATHGSNSANFNFPWLKINTNMFIYYAQALANGNSVAEAIDQASRSGANGGRLRWIYSYAGYYSSTNLVYTNMDGSLTTNSVNTALRQSSTIDSDGDGYPNLVDPTPFFEPSQINLMVIPTNVPPKMVKVEWTTIPNATNFVYYTTNLLATNNWLAFTNFKNWYFGNNVAVTNAAHVNYFHSPQTYISSPPIGSPDNFQQTNVWFFDSVTNVPHYYKVVVWPWLNFPE